MTPDQLLAKLSAREDNFTERKSESVAPAELRRTACAFANSLSEGQEAVLFIGVHDHTGAVEGVTNSDALQKRLRDALQACYPPVSYGTTVFDVDGKSVVAVVFPASRDKPHFTGPAFVRIGSESVNASKAQYEELILNRIDKAREIQRYRGAIFTVRGIGYQLGSGRPLADRHYVEGCECRLVRCTGHLVTLQDIATDRQFSEPLANITIRYDDARQRPLLEVRFP